MSAIPLATGALVVYKSRPAVVSSVTDKIEIQLEGGKSKKVREKDVQPLHPGPARLSGLAPDPVDVSEAWELLADEQMPLADLAELVYGDFTPAAAWGVWELLGDGVYFEGELDAIKACSAEQVAAVQAERVAKARAEQEWQEFLERVGAADLNEEDHKRLGEVERVALGQLAASKILAAFDVAASPQAAHAFLTRCGYWRREHNPHPGRIGVTMQGPELDVPELAEEERVDLTHLPAYAIDDEGNQDPDDAISLDGDRIWVHVADVAALVAPDSELDLAARERGANLYLPETTIPMLPDAITERLGLGLHEESPALSFGFRLVGGEPVDIEIVRSRVRVTRTTYQAAHDAIDDDRFGPIARLIDGFRERRLANNAARIDLPEVSVRRVDGEIRIRSLPRLSSRDLVTDAMLAAGEVAARFAEQEDLAIPFVQQPTPDEIRQPESMAEMYAYRRLFKPSQASTVPGAHFGLGLNIYARATSPLRRYQDLVTHQQLRAKLRGEEPLSREQVGERLAVSELAGNQVRKTERLSNQHWKLVYLSENSDWQGDAVVVALEERRAAVIIPELAMETKIRLVKGLELNQPLKLKVREIDLPNQDAFFTPVK